MKHIILSQYCGKDNIKRNSRYNQYRGVKMVFSLKKSQDVRVDNDLSQKDMSQILGISEDVYSNQENGRSNMRIDVAVKFANYFGLSLDYLLSISNKKIFKCNILYDASKTRHILRKVRLNRNLSQERMANLLNIPQRTYSSYECGYRAIPLEFLFYFALKFSISVDFLTGRKNTEKI